MQINGILEIINSRRDTYGNCYFAFKYTDTATDQTVSATVSGGHSNIASIPFYLHGGSFEPRDIHVYDTELPIREFNRLTKSWPYAGCVPEELAKYIQRTIKDAKAA